MKRQLFEALQELYSLQKELNEFERVVSDIEEIYSASIEELCLEFESWVKLYFWSNDVNKKYFDEKYIFEYWADSNELKPVKVYYEQKEYPLDFTIPKNWDLKKIKKAFYAVKQAYISRKELKKILEEPISDCKSFIMQLEEAVESRKQEIYQNYTNFVNKSEKISEDSLLESFFNNEKVKETIIEELLGVKI